MWYLQMATSMVVLWAMPWAFSLANIDSFYSYVEEDIITFVHS